MSASPSEAASTITSPARWKHGLVPVIGLTGEIGAGKSRVARLLSALGSVVIDADLIGHLVLEDLEVRRQVIRRFGAQVVTRPSGTGGVAGPIDRKALGALVFSDARALRDLEAILHPPMVAKFEEIIDQKAHLPGTRAIVLDAAILLEAGWDRLCDLVVYVEAPRQVRLERVKVSRGWSAEVLDAREAAQWPRQRKLDRASVVIQNDSSPEQLEAIVDSWFGRLVGRQPAETIG